MNKSHFVVYIPGFGDGADKARSVALGAWRLFGVRAQLVPMLWFNDEHFEVKRDRVLAVIDRAHKDGYLVTLVGESAGASMAINVAAERPELHRLVTIAGATDPTAVVSRRTLEQSPSFAESFANMTNSKGVFPFSKTITFRGIGDRVIRSQHAAIKEAINYVVPAFGHRATISLCLTLFSPFIIAKIK